MLDAGKYPFKSHRLRKYHMQKSWMQEKNAECSGNTELLNVAEAQGLWKSEARKR